jgi:hypothetical protein
MFTGRLPSSHAPTFQIMGLRDGRSELAEVCRPAVYSTDLVSRNFVFDGTFPASCEGSSAGIARSHPSAANLAGVL